jgi:ABC-type phosphate transport system substrate-binding protein
MSRTQLLGAASAAVLASFSTAHAQSSVQGGGSTLAQFAYIDEFSIYNSSTTGATFGSYWEAGSGSGQSAFLNDDLTCDINKVNGNNGGACSNEPPGTTNYVDYGASDATLSASQIAAWSTASYGQSVSGNLIQMPSMGVGISFPVINSAVKKNGAVSLSDHDECEIFSGGYTDFSQITDSVSLKGASSKFAPGTISVIYRGDGSGTSFLLTQHLAAVCTANDTAPGFTFTATTTFASLFNPSNGGGSNTKNSQGLYVVTSGLYNGVNDGPQGSGGIATQMEDSPKTPQISYLSPDFTTVDPQSDATVNGAKPTLVVASALQGTKPELPTVKEITNGLAHPISGTNLNPPSTAAQGANPALWVPAVAKDSSGYPVVGYTTYDFAQCYADPTIAAAIISYFGDHISKKGSFSATLKRNGFVEITNSKAENFVKTIEQHILSNYATKKSPAWNIDINDPVACKHLGR